MRRIVILAIICVSGQVTAQDPEEPWFELNGYVKDLFNLNVTEDYSEAIYENLIHNRFDGRIYAGDHLTFGFGMRNRLFIGDRIQLFRDFGTTYGTLLELQRQGWADMSESWIDNEQLVLHTVIDRLWGEYTNDKLEIRLGRQRINWGKNTIWNPNDIFNSYSYIDFDYEERPGTDAVRVQYFLDYASRIELGYSPRSTWEESTLAGYYSFNRWDYDFQVMGGKFQDYTVTGVGWAGNIGPFGFNGEGTIFVPGQDSLSSYIVGGISGNYLIGNGIFLNAEVLYNGNEAPLDLFDLQSSGIQANNLSPFTWSAFMGGSYPFHPLFSASFGGITYPEEGLFFISPSFTASITNNLDFLILGQLFVGDIDELTGGAGGGFASYTNTYAFRLKWSF